MLPPFIIEQIRQREEDERDRHDAPLQLPLHVPEPPPSDGPRGTEDQADRGVVIIDL